MAEFLLVFPERDDADDVAEEYRHEGFADVRVVREALAGEDDSEDHEWAVCVRTSDGPSDPVPPGLIDRLTTTAAEKGGWLDQQVQ